MKPFYLFFYIYNRSIKKEGVMEDYRIVDLYWARSESAIEQTKYKYGRMLMGVSFALLQNEGDAEECVNDTYLAAWNSMPTERPSYLGAFLSKIIRRLSINRYRTAHAEKRGGISVLTEELTECIPSTVSVETDYENRALADAINRFLLSLDEEKRYIFVRRYFYSDSLAEIAQKCRMREGKVKTALFRTRGALKAFLEREGVVI